MQFVESTKNIRCIKNIYDKEIGKGRAHTICSIPVDVKWYDIENLDDIKQLMASDPENKAHYLSADDVKEIKEWLLEREAQAKNLAEAQAFESLSENLRMAVRHLGLKTSEIELEYAKDLYVKMDLLSKELKRRGFKKGELLSGQ